MQVYRVGNIANGTLRFCDDVVYASEIAGILCGLDGVSDGRSDAAWTLEIPAENRLPIRLKLPPLISTSASLEEPLFLPDRQLIYFHDHLFVADRPPRTAEECREIVVEIKKRVRGETSEPKKAMSRPPRVPKDYVELWIHSPLAADLTSRYAGTDAIYATTHDIDVLRQRHSAEPPSLPVSLDGLLYELDKLTGLSAVKREIRSLINHLRVQQLRKQEGLPTGQMTMHLVFTGNPGTGKTTVARLLAKIYKAMGFLPQGQLVETDRGGLVGEYLGQTAPKTLQVIQKAVGGVLFIDEAYALVRTTHGQKDMFGLEAIDTLLKAMEDNREKLVVIAAGYPDEMKHFIESNPGLRSRFTRHIDFPDYSPAELMQIFEQQISDGGYMLTESAQKRAAAILEAAYQSRAEGFGNGRTVRTMFERASLKLSDRIAGDIRVTRAELMTLHEADIPYIDTAP